MWRRLCSTLWRILSWPWRWLVAGEPTRVRKRCSLCDAPRQSFHGVFLCVIDDMTDRMPGGCDETLADPEPVEDGEG